MRWRLGNSHKGFNTTKQSGSKNLRWLRFKNRLIDDLDWHWC